ncbi:MAG: ABC transporter ATP-binding protein [Dissulfurispiraceae bacterium]|jgi:putative ABC transport system ATP-binding protein|nr:ABC transporter ATP-binding protein [Dissulfurispiraceae bacterium]
MNLCELKDIRKTYRIGDDDIEVLKGITLDIEKDEFLAIMGTSGSGKTTLMNMIGCLDVPTSGSYRLSGQEISSLSDDELSRIRNEHIGFIFQSFHLLPYATVLENVLLPTLYLEDHKDNLKARALKLLELVGLQDRAKFKPSQLSGGQQQRVAIARALVNEPELLLADEPTGQLDSSTAAEIMKILKEMNKSGTTVVLITHDENTASHAKRIIKISDGILG